MTKNNTPKLRFPEFTDEWKEKKFEDLFEFFPTNSFPRSNLNEESGEVQNIHYGDIHKKFPTLLDFNKVDVPFINEDVNLEKFKEDNYCQDGDLVIADASEDYEDIGKAIELANISNRKVLSGLHTFLARDKSNLTTKKYRVYILLNNNVRLQIKKIATGISVLGISKTNLGKLKISIPNLEEQRKIANLLTKLDEKISLLEDRLDFFRDFKKFCMQQLFAEKLRFRQNICCKWEEKRMKDLLNHSSSNLSVTALENNFGQYPLYGATGLIKNIDFYEKKKDYIAIVKDGAGVGRTFYCPAYSSILGTLQYLINTEGNNLKFIYYLLSSLKFEKYIIGSTIPHIYFKDYSKKKVNIPCLEEQVQIANFLTNLDKKIDQIVSELEHINEFKKSLLQQMFV